MFSFCFWEFKILFDFLDFITFQNVLTFEGFSSFTFGVELKFPPVNSISIWPHKDKEKIRFRRSLFTFFDFRKFSIVVCVCFVEAFLFSLDSNCSMINIRIFSACLAVSFLDWLPISLRSCSCGVDIVYLLALFH